MARNVPRCPIGYLAALLSCDDAVTVEIVQCTLYMMGCLVVSNITRQHFVFSMSYLSGTLAMHACILSSSCLVKGLNSTVMFGLHVATVLVMYDRIMATHLGFVRLVCKYMTTLQALWKPQTCVAVGLANSIVNCTLQASLTK